jgi:hypothetical protein
MENTVVTLASPRQSPRNKKRKLATIDPIATGKPATTKPATARGRSARAAKPASRKKNGANPPAQLAPASAYAEGRDGESPELEEEMSEEGEEGEETVQGALKMDVQKSTGCGPTHRIIIFPSRPSEKTDREMDYRQLISFERVDRAKR